MKKPVKKLVPAVALIAAFALSACGTSDLERGAAGAAIGAVGAKALGHDPLVGGAIGATAGVLCDNVTPQICN